VTAHGWTIAEAIAEFERAGVPVDPARFRIAVTRVARLPRAGEMPSGEKGGRGQVLYPIGELQRLHSALIPWLMVRETEGALHGVAPKGLLHGAYGSSMPESPERRRERYANDPEYRARRDAATAAYRAQNRDRINARKRATYAANPEPTRAVNRAWRAANAQKVAEQNRIRGARRDRAKDSVRHLYRKHGITPQEWTEIWTLQEGCCYLCGTRLAADPCRNAVVDHDHSCCGPQKSCSACRRGIACRPCNSIIGLAGDSPELLHQIAERLRAALALHAQRLASRPAEILLF
jgi:hypothetical protein